MSERVYVAPDADHMVGYHKVLDGESVYHIPENVWAEYVDAWFKYINAKDKLENSLRVDWGNE